ncbi:MAG: F0F1 ATP synthase subunit delta [Burkholderiaceae bacterium]
MAELATIARPYAEALFRVARAGNLMAWSDLLAEMAYVASNPDVQSISHDPKILDSDMSATFVSLIRSPMTEEANNFVSMLVENGRISLLPEISTQFQALKNAQEGAANAAITSAFVMSDAQVTALVGALEVKFGRKLNPSVSVDNALIGGVRVIVGDEVLDTSVRAKLQQMHIALTT